ncbi:stage III sporulation protein AE [Thermoclostridium stercorarium subsp. stercorarium DSM 8532]|jgi:stage III sporulation protein AE|uniref:Stage III sporulation protein AE n=3 Tax=Thermoclostridium stercorarium TaxID=1510 RepID=L7VLG9_THES1|nr:stage III sporulation protein AE [Thermoclostridium stercorarium]AGC67557.1 stage III sporulation protein AE [Thermoclostridium stercorarium subsp. stercorarium DSM 8532]AGI38606.1 sporulation protein 3AE [Thermoclostridium stercorarium subsp. stercorarium DSM 8532]ANW97981.1 stage III sporulation protein AE [Thermoclostridium stercorarium subsp. thermolacticum DSM 2910]ANX00531.1 stage III sporulation protein AE [Thermoclostridium stercorarium subsp. leptospartum DSM 9219]UZQ86142.1 stage 
MKKRVGIPQTKPLRIILCVMFAFIISASPCASMAEDAESVMEEILKSQLESSEIRNLQNNLEKSLSDEARELLPYYSVRQLMQEIVSGNVQESMETLPQKLINIFIAEIKNSFSLVVKLIIVVFLSAFINNLQGAFKESAVGELAYFACYAALVSMLALGFHMVLEYAGEVLDTIDSITGFAIPALLALLISSGNVASGTALKPVLLFAIQATVKVFRNIFLPLCLMAGILYIVSGLSEKIKVSGMASLIRQMVTWGLGAILAGYSSLVVIQGVTGAVIDGATVKTTKTAITTFIPVAGKYIADAADTVISCALVVKNTAGVLTMIVTLAACCIPIIKIFIIVLMYRFTAAIIEPFAEERFFDCITDVSDCMKVVLGVVGSSVFMFLLSVGALLGAGGISGMMQ